MDNSIITLVTDDSDEYDVDIHVARRCGALARALRDEKAGTHTHRTHMRASTHMHTCRRILTHSVIIEIEEEGCIFVSDVSMWSLQLVLDFCEYDWPGDERERPGHDEHFETIKDLLQADPLDPNMLCELASASYQLDCKPLVEITCKAIAGTIKGRSAEEIR